MTETPRRRPVILLMGPTASGKSAAAVAIAQRWPIEIINVDSATIYREMDIGTAKPGAEERANVTHHLLDICDPSEAYSAARFRSDALQLINDIHARGQLPVLAGGTMMYFKALQQGLAQLPAAHPALRAELEEDARRLGWPVLHERLRALDPVTAARLAPNDSQRIQRALEVCILSGVPLSALLTQNSPQRKLAHDVRDLHFVEISLEPTSRAALHERIKQRFLQMMELGFLAEVSKLHARGDLSIDLPSVRCVGYRQLWGHLEGDYSLNEAQERAIAATRQLAKRQLTWLRSRPNRHIVDCGAGNPQAHVIDIVHTQLSAFEGDDTPWSAEIPHAAESAN